MRNDCVVEISTAPKATTNYFDVEGNSLPFELSPAFFKPDALLKYKADRGKYIVEERRISCRSAWALDGIDVNEAGQVHVYICNLRRLPYKEQIYWLSFNEPPKTGIAKRAFAHDFEGQWIDYSTPLQKLKDVVQNWHDHKVVWWKLRDEKFLGHVNTPLTESSDEWAESFMDLAKLIIEGFDTKPIRAKLDMENIRYEKEDKTISLLEKLLNKAKTSVETQKLDGLRTVQNLRSKVKGHVGGGESDQLKQDALLKHETFREHFNHICGQVTNELISIEMLMKLK